MGFNWSDYAVVEGPDLYRADGTLKPSITQDQIRFYQESKILLEKTMDQLSATPEFQQRLLHAAENGPLRLLEAGNEERLGDPRLIIKLPYKGDSKYDPLSHSVSLGIDSLTEMTYGSPPYPFTLQGVLYHEIGHAADPELNQAQADDLKIRKAAFEKALDKTFEQFPDLRAAYGESGLVMGKDVSAIRNAKNGPALDSAYLDFQEGSLMKMTLDNGKPSEEGIYADPSLRAKSYIHTLYENFTARENERVFELPIIENTNTFMQKYYGEPPRTDYAVNKGKQHKSDDEDYAEDLEKLKKRIHPDLDAKSGIVALAATSIDGVSVETLAKPLPRMDFMHMPPYPSGP